MAYSDNFPATRPVFMADFANGGKIDPRATFTRADTPPTYAAPSAVHYWSNEKHLSSENLVDYSDDISQSSWTKNNMSETGGQTAPDGGTDAYKLTENSATSNHQIYKLIKTDGSAITFSGYFKYIGRQWVRIRLSDSSGVERHVWFDIQNGAVGTAQTGFSGATITASGNGYYKVSVTLSTSLVGGTQFIVIAGIDADNSTSWYAGSGADAFAVWGIQVSTTGETVLNETSGSIHRQYAPTLKSVATAGQPRFEYSTDGQSVAKGILIEGQSTNLLTYSSDMSNAAWTKGYVSASAEAIGPDGQLSAFAIRELGGLQYRNITQVITTGSGSVAFSVYAKLMGNARRLIIREDAATGNAAVFDLNNGTVVTATGGVTGSVESASNGWYRCTMVSTPGAGARLFALHLASSTATTIEQYTGDGYSGLLLAMPQAEDQSFSSSWISTTSSTTTRAAESLSMPIASTGYTGGPVSVNAEFNANSVSSGTPRVFALKNGSNIVMSYITSGGSLSTFADVDGSNSVNTYIKGGLAANTDYKMAISYGTDDYQGACGGDLGTPDTACALPDLESGTLYLGSQDGSHFLNGNLKRLSLFSEAISDTNLQAITS